MYFIGQPHIMRQLADILPYLYESGDGMAISLRGPSGWGKTRLAFMICNYLSKPGGDFTYCLGDNVVIDTSKRVHFVDEIHLMEHPETLYPLIDSKKYVFVFATNDVALLNEALANRCAEFIFDKYSKEELREIARTCLSTELPDDFIDYIVESGSGNPRIIKNYINRLNIMLIRNKSALSGIDLVGFKSVMEYVFGIQDGMDILCQRYIAALKDVGGTASIQTLSTYLHVDQNTLKYHVEPALLYKSLIKITSKGRSLV